MDEYLCLVVLARPGESEPAFKARLSAFWTLMLRQHEAVFARVYAETSACELRGDRLARSYLFEAGCEATLLHELAGQCLEHEEIDLDDVYSKYEAAPPEWFWIEH